MRLQLKQSSKENCYEYFNLKVSFTMSFYNILRIIITKWWPAISHDVILSSEISLFSNIFTCIENLQQSNENLIVVHLMKIFEQNQNKYTSLHRLSQEDNIITVCQTYQKLKFCTFEINHYKLWCLPKSSKPSPCLYTCQNHFPIQQKSSDTNTCILK